MTHLAYPLLLVSVALAVYGFMPDGPLWAKILSFIVFLLFLAFAVADDRPLTDEDLLDFKQNTAPKPA